MSERLDRPYPGFFDELGAQIKREAAAADPLRSDHDGAGEEVRAALTQTVEELGDELRGLSHEIHANPELGYDEHHAVATVAELLQTHGHETEVGAYGLETALRARVGEGRPRVAVLAEYDALPGIGHGCGHNIICATAVGAFLALATRIDELGGSVELIGTPAEEGGGGKELIARAGGFDEIDAALMLHPAGFDVAEHPWLGVRTVEVTYHGLSAHAAMMPFLGRNALDAVVQAYLGIAQLRQHVLPTDRVHGIITDGGQRPNIIPERAQATFYLRSAQPSTLVELVDRARAIFEAAATATATDVTIKWDPTPVYLPVRNSHPLAARYAENLRRRGRQVLPEGVVPPWLTGSTDLGNVSMRVPAIHPTLAIAPPGVTIHSSEFAEAAISSAADSGTVDGAIGLALTAADFLADAALRDEVREHFEATGGVIDVDALLA
ncbi:MAG: M20 family metallopeptidase [Egibacteraceae bacterium]